MCKLFKANCKQSRTICQERTLSSCLNDLCVSPQARAFYGFQIAIENIHSGAHCCFACLLLS